MPSAGSQLIPRVRWDLTLHPRSLAAAHALDRGEVYRLWDRSVGTVILLVVAASWWQWIFHRGFVAATAVFCPTLLFEAAFLWFSQERFKHTYIKHRLPAAIAFKFVNAIPAAVALDQGADMIDKVVILGSDKATLLLKVWLLGLMGVTPAEAVGVQTPMKWTVLHLCAKTHLLLTRNVVKQLVRFAMAPRYQAAAESLLAAWGFLLQGAAPLSVPRHPRLSDAGRSCSMFLLVTTQHVTLVGVLTYVSYLFNASGIRIWLGQKLQQMTAARASTLMIGGACVSREQLLAMLSNPAIALLLDRPTTRQQQHLSPLQRRLVKLAAHALALGLICHLALLISEVIVLQLLPRLGSDETLNTYCPVH